MLQGVARQVLARGVLLIKYLLLGQTYRETLYGEKTLRAAWAGSGAAVMGRPMTR
jgi:hypothetical protein